VEYYGKFAIIWLLGNSKKVSLADTFLELEESNDGKLSIKKFHKTLNLYVIA